jgi:hypothetical protein
MEHLPEQLAQGFEVSVERHGKNEKPWEKLYNNPTVGLSFLATGSGNQNVLGTAFGLHAFVLVPIVQKKHFNLKTSWGWGLGYLTKKFDPVTNYENIAIGSHLNLFASIKLLGEFMITPQWAISGGLSYNHWSNSAFKYPNLGLNIPQLNLGMRYSLNPVQKFDKLSKTEKSAFNPEKKHEIVGIMSIGFKSYNIIDPKTYHAYTAELNYAYLWSAKWKISGGLDLFYNLANKRELELSDSHSQNTALQIGTNICYHQTLGNFSILAGLGVYVFDETLQSETTYIRFGTRYAINNKLILSTILHTHQARADHFKLGIGYKFTR